MTQLLRGVFLVPSLLGRCKQKQRGLRGLLCRWPSITEWEVHQVSIKFSFRTCVCITVQGPRLRSDLYCVEWDVKLYYTIPYPPSIILAAVAIIVADDWCIVYRLFTAAYLRGAGIDWRFMSRQRITNHFRDEKGMQVQNMPRPTQSLAVPNNTKCFPKL